MPWEKLQGQPHYYLSTSLLPCTYVARNMAREGLNPEAAKWKHFAPARGREGEQGIMGRAICGRVWSSAPDPDVVGDGVGVRAIAITAASLSYSQTVMPPSNREEEKERKAGPRGCAPAPDTLHPCAHGIRIAALLQPVRVWACDSASPAVRAVTVSGPLALPPLPPVILPLNIHMPLQWLRTGPLQPPPCRPIL